MNQTDLDFRLQAQRLAPLPGWLTGRARRRAVACLPPLALLTCGLLAATRPDDTVHTVLLGATAVLAVAGILLLRRASRLLDAVPDRLLDEREIGERNTAHRHAHGLTIGLLALLSLLAIADASLTRATGDRLIPGDNWIQVMVTATLVACMLPAAVIAWRWTELDEPVGAR